ncbi:Hypothetical protein CINCED_3A005278 [Cinara cedri]|nr:Hypothetical protein CINCED_3A005278 [Cinara cedri]
MSVVPTELIQNDSTDETSNGTQNVQHNLPSTFYNKLAISTELLQNDSTDNTSNAVQDVQYDLPSRSDNNPKTPLDDLQYLLDNAVCFQKNCEVSQKKGKNKKDRIKDNFQFTNQFIFGIYHPPYYSVLHSSLMEKYVAHLKNPSVMDPNSLLFKYMDLISYERERFAVWLSDLWENELKHRRLYVIPEVEDYIKSAYQFSNSYIKSHYNGMYRSKMKMDYTEDGEVMEDNITMTHSERIKSSNIKYAAHFPKVDITNLESKISFKNGIYTPPQKSPFVDDKLCQTLFKENNIDIAICLSSIKHIMNLEKPNKLWLMPVDIIVDTDDNHKSVYIGGALATGHFSQQQKKCFYLRKEIKKKFRKLLSEEDSNTQDNSKYNYDKWTLAITNKSNGNVKSLNLLIRNMPQINKLDQEFLENILIPKLEYQPEFGFEKNTEEQLGDYWMDTYLRNPKSCFSIVSVQYNLDIMMIKKENRVDDLLSDTTKQIYFQRLYQTLDKCLQLDEGRYMMLHNPKKPFEIELFHSSVYGGFNLLNMHYILGETEVPELLTWNPIEENVICPIHDHFKVPPCMFRPTPTMLNIRIINNTVDKYNEEKEANKQFQKQKAIKKNLNKKEKRKAKQKQKKEDELVFTKSLTQT